MMRSKRTNFWRKRSNLSKCEKFRKAVGNFVAKIIPRELGPLETMNTNVVHGTSVTRACTNYATCFQQMLLGVANEQLERTDMNSRRNMTNMIFTLSLYLSLCLCWIVGFCIHAVRAPQANDSISMRRWSAAYQITLAVNFNWRWNIEMDWANRHTERHSSQNK